MVTKQEQLIYEMVLERDRVMTYANDPIDQLHYGSLEKFLMDEPWVCVAPIIDPNQSGPCSGEMERDHVHQHAGGTRSKRPLTTMETLVILCHHHHQDGWATSHRPEIRDYIKEANERYGQVRQL
jgi:hypothetical protein